MEAQVPPESRPYRSHKFPACKVCKTRKIRCIVDAPGHPCRFCRESSRICEYAENPVDQGHEPSSRRRKSNPARTLVPIARDDAPGLAANVTGTSPTESLLILEPAMAEDVEAVEHYLTAHGSPAAAAGPYRLVSNTSGQAIVYLTVPRRRKGLEANAASPGAKQLEIMENVLGHCKQHLVDVYFDKLHPCFPIIDARTFHDMWDKNPERLSPALLCEIYASALHFWRLSAYLTQYPRPDLAFMWNQAVAAMQEDYLGSTISTVHASLLDLIGRPVMSITGNIITLARTVALAHSLGLHRDPSNWKATGHEKNVRTRLWWGVVVHDHWSSVAHGTPPLNQQQNYDVPLPDELLEAAAPDSHKRSAVSFLHLCKVSRILGELLPHLYALDPGKDDQSRHVRRLECALDEWQSSLPPFLDLTLQSEEHVNGSSSLRFCFLSLQLLLCRVAYKNARSGDRGVFPEERYYRLAMLRDAASKLTDYVSALEPAQLTEFWLPYTAHLLVYACTVLLRCILEAPDLETRKTCSRKLVGLQHRLKLARDSGWDLANFCLERCSEPISKIAAAMGVSGDVMVGHQTVQYSNVTEGCETSGDPALSLPADFLLPLGSWDDTFDSFWEAAL